MVYIYSIHNTYLCIIPSIIITIIILIIKYKINIMNKLLQICNVCKNMYANHNVKYILPIHYTKKSKQSPFIGPQSSSKSDSLFESVPNYHLERNNNVHVHLNIPYRRFQSYNKDNKITIMTIVEKVSLSQIK